MTDLHPLAERYRTTVEAGDLAALAKLYHPDALLDAHVPNWRFQIEGRDAVVEHSGGLPSPGRYASFQAEPTASGDLLVQFEWRQQADEGGAVVRQLHLWRLDDGLIAEQLIFCSGIWGPQLREVMAVESPLVRP